MPNTIVDVLRRLNVKHVSHGEHHHVTQGWVGIDCPYCSPRSMRFRCGVPVSGRGCNCWVCGKRNLASVLQLACGESIGKILPMLQDLGDFLAEDVKRQHKLILPKGIGPLWVQHKRYLLERGFDPDEITEQWEVQGIANHKTLPWRLFIPITLDSEVVSWTTRAVTGAKTRYVNAKTNEESVPAKSLLYGAEKALHSVIVFEGPTDVWRVGPGAVATMGVGYTKAQLCEMTKYPRRVVCFDSERDAQRRAKKLCQELEAYEGETLLATLDSKDAASASVREIRELRSMLR